MRLFYFVLFVNLFCFNAYSHPINFDLAVREIKIDSDFNGIDMLIFGMLDVSGDVVVIVHGPRRSIIINKKEKRYGLWVNGKREKLDDIKQFYSVSSGRDLHKVMNENSLQKISLSAMKFCGDSELEAAFKDMKIKNGLYVELANNVDLINERLFRSNIHFPKNIPKGRYIIEVLLFYRNDLFGVQTLPLLVSNIGIESFVFDMHILHPFLYALSAVLGALFIGWFSSLIKRR